MFVEAIMECLEVDILWLQKVAAVGKLWQQWCNAQQRACCGKCRCDSAAVGETGQLRTYDGSRIDLRNSEAVQQQAMADVSGHAWQAW